MKWPCSSVVTSALDRGRHLGSRSRLSDGGRVVGLGVVVGGERELHPLGRDGGDAAGQGHAAVEAGSRVRAHTLADAEVRRAGAPRSTSTQRPHRSQERPAPDGRVRDVGPGGHDDRRPTGDGVRDDAAARRRCVGIGRRVQRLGRPQQRVGDQYVVKIDRFRTLAGQLLGVINPKAQTASVER